jgi:hypothetical protein
LQDVKAHLPAQAHSLYYKDIIGNISSSDTTHTTKEVRPAGGLWANQWTQQVGA